MPKDAFKKKIVLKEEKEDDHDADDEGNGPDKPILTKEDKEEEQDKVLELKD